MRHGWVMLFLVVIAVHPAGHDPPAGASGLPAVGPRPVAADAAPASTSEAPAAARAPDLRIADHPPGNPAGGDGGPLVGATRPGDLPDTLRSAIPAPFTYEPEVTALLREASAQLAETLADEEAGPPMKEQWWAFSHEGSVEEAFADLDLPQDAYKAPPTTAPLANVLAAHSDTSRDLLAAVWGREWRERLEARAGEWADVEQRLAIAMWWRYGDLLTPRDDPRAPVIVQVFLGGENVSEWSAGVVLESAQGGFVTALLPDPDEEAVVGRVLPGVYEAFFFSDRDGVKGFSMDTTRLHVVPERGAKATVRLERWDFPMMMPWSMADLQDAEAYLDVAEDADKSFVSLYLVDPYVNPRELTAAAGAHLLVSCRVDGEESLLRTTGEGGQ